MGDTWREDSPTVGPDRFYRWGEHDGQEMPHRFRWTFRDGSAASGWVPCTFCEELALITDGD